VSDACEVRFSSCGLHAQVWYTEKTGLNYKVCVPHAQAGCMSRVTIMRAIAQVCNGSGEDPTCADSVDILDFSVADHLVRMPSAVTPWALYQLLGVQRAQVYLDLPICGCKQLGPLPQ